MTPSETSPAEHRRRIEAVREELAAQVALNLALAERLAAASGVIGRNAERLVGDDCPHCNGTGEVEGTRLDGADAGPCGECRAVGFAAPASALRDRLWEWAWRCRAAETRAAAAEMAALELPAALRPAAPAAAAAAYEVNPSWVRNPETVPKVPRDAPSSEEHRPNSRDFRDGFGGSGDADTPVAAPDMGDLGDQNPESGGEAGDLEFAHDDRPDELRGAR